MRTVRLITGPTFNGTMPRHARRPVDNRTYVQHAHAASWAMRLSRKDAENLLPIRAAVLSGRFDQMWDAVKKFAPSLNHARGEGER